MTPFLKNMKQHEIRSNVLTSVYLLGGVIQFFQSLNLNEDLQSQIRNQKNDVVEIINLFIFSSLFLADMIDCHYSLVLEVLLEVVVEGRVQAAKLEETTQANDVEKN
jgi:hypothetical protein